MRRVARCQPSRATNRHRLLTGLTDAAHNQIIDSAGIKLIAFDEADHHLHQKVGRMDGGESAARLTAPHGRPYNINNYRNV